MFWQDEEGLHMPRRMRILLPALAVAGIGIAALAPRTVRSEHHESGLASVTDAVAVLHATEGNTAHGVVRFMDHGEGKVHVTATLSGLKPGAKHGFHIHQFGDCTSPDGKSAGGHYDPAGVGHHGEPVGATRAISATCRPTLRGTRSSTQCSPAFPSRARCTPSSGAGSSSTRRRTTSGSPRATLARVSRAAS